MAVPAAAPVTILLTYTKVPVEVPVITCALCLSTLGIKIPSTFVVAPVGFVATMSKVVVGVPPIPTFPTLSILILSAPAVEKANVLDVGLHIPIAGSAENE